MSLLLQWQCLYFSPKLYKTAEHICDSRRRVVRHSVYPVEYSVSDATTVVLWDYGEARLIIMSIDCYNVMFILHES